ncbi:hypothetical protein SSX86_017978 [Deinandra increscens subsp. villosa]|uniref:Receptor-like serine/threonine-protein kinase n=1 Tax=Deinandra increscens subsp. villosa TaxID=3103831 RepID=A0AAP0CW57_9ASTR
MLLPTVTFLFLSLATSAAVDTISVNQNIEDGETIVSRNENFELGFFSPGSSKNRYLGIWFKNTSPQTVVWVANRETPLLNTSGTIKLNNQGVLSLVGDGIRLIWSSNSFASKTSVSYIAQLLDTGNLVIKDNNSVIWQSFDYPGDTLISGMKLGKNLITGREMYLTSWRSVDDPSPGEYTISFLMIKGKYPQVYIRRNSVTEIRIGPYDGIEFAGQPNYRRNSNHMYEINVVFNHQEIYYTHGTNSTNSTTFPLRMIMTPGGKVEVWLLNMVSRDWMPDLTIPMDYCENYGICGPYGSCSTATFPNCECLKGFELKNPQEVNQYKWTNGCRRSRALDCGDGDGFIKFSSMKLPDTQNAVYDSSMSLEECGLVCKDNCSCTAYANPNVTTNGIGCLRWFGDLVDIRVYSLNGQDLYVRQAAFELSGNMVSESIFNKKKGVLTVVIPASSATLLLFAVAYSCRKKNKKPGMKGRGNRHALHKKGIRGDMSDLDEQPSFSLKEIVKATDNFSINNKIGEGGFGPVYKGVLEDGREVAVKRLSKTSQQGLEEFMNEVICIAKLQHRNLVNLLGYYIHGNEMILVYEYMANESLDAFLFDETRSSMLDWPQRFHIIQGMARGILYLHQDSRLQIIHRDLKAANILLDCNMNPKISDFGLARKFVGPDTTAKTKKVVGTYGYISPEYAVHGKFSIKSDVFSFGVLVLEIVSGKKNREFSHEDHSDNLLGHAWRLYKENRSIELMSPSLYNSCVVSEVLRVIHVGLLCVQHHADDRPTMLSVVLMLVSEGVLPPPKQPAFYTGESYIEVKSLPTADEYMITQLYPR